MKRLSIILAVFGLTACNTLSGAELETRPSDTPVAYTANADLALDLAEALQGAVARDDARLGALGDEMQALYDALTAPEALPVEISGEPENQPIPTDILAPAPDLSDARSVLFGAHIASYRQVDLARQGWQLFSQLPAFQSLNGRIEAVTLDDGNWLRLKAGPFETSAQVEAFCDRIQSSGDWCMVTDFTGQAVDD